MQGKQNVSSSNLEPDLLNATLVSGKMWARKTFKREIQLYLNNQGLLKCSGIGD